MDFAFVRWPSSDGQKGNLCTCYNGYNFYLLIVNVAMQFLLEFPSSGKDPPCDLIKHFLQKYSNNDKIACRRIRTDNGRELSKSLKFKQTIENLDSD